ncbi:PepSY-associated TM helix domain-containing protein [Pseudomonas sp. MUP55]|uniref:PepSY-associated TM helix domain-containing protein n=1 Tax=Pseudomonas sp. MUP55 TaxID=3087234 RepID=UPI002A5A98CE|nr:MULTISPECIES: PepSY-associated TM helix domain-containing protein [unclassified Pseudomonas]WPN93822.1 PepSY-associated TM helix domain-containing protein [Pseudomonas sp. MUP56]WPN99348.1 PepSY-associated TM helix domain-containing protein [Pseudomonas sp. MUP55]
MKEGFRQAMAWLHTWAGLIFGWLLFAIFLTGTLAYFKDEITHWMQPEVQAHPLDDARSLAVAQRYLQQQAPTAARWFITLPTHRDPGLSVMWQDKVEPGKRGTFIQKVLDPVSGQAVQARESKGGEFFYRFHFQLQMPYPWGRWLATLAAMVMFVALITGIITHKKIFKDFFTFRPRKGQRSWLDGHNAVGVLVLPFHLMITYSSLVIFMNMVMPAPILASYGDDSRAFFNEVFPSSENAPALGQPGTLLPLWPMYQQAQQQWAGGHVGRLAVNNPSDVNASVNVFRAGSDSLVHDFGSSVSFNGTTGELLRVSGEPSLPAVIGGSFYGLHMGHFAGPVLRWLYFICGLAGTAMIGTGLVIWLGKRQLKHAKTGVMPFELRLVQVLNIASMSGLVIAIAAFFWANRWLPVSFAERSDWEVQAFFIAWALSLLHALVRHGRQAWVEQLSLAALLFVAIPLVNALTTSQHLGVSLVKGDWAMACFDLTCLASGLFLAWAAWKMRCRTASQPQAERARSLTLKQEAG